MRVGNPLTEALRVAVVVRVDVIDVEGERVPVVVRDAVVVKDDVRVPVIVAVEVNVETGVRVVVTVFVIGADRVAVREAAAEGVEGMVGLGDLDGNPERVAVRVVVGVFVGIILIAAS